MPIERGELYLVELNLVPGREPAGRRPVLVLSINALNRLPLFVTVVLGTKGENVTRDYPTNVRVASAESGLPMETVLLGFQLRSLDPVRFAGPPAGAVSGATLSIEQSRDRCSPLSGFVSQSLRPQRQNETPSRQAARAQRETPFCLAQPCVFAPWRLGVKFRSAFRTPGRAGRSRRNQMQAESRCKRTGRAEVWRRRKQSDGGAF